MAATRRLEVGSMRLADVVGLALLALIGAWVGLVAGGGDGRRAPVLALLVSLAVMVAVGRFLSPRLGWVPAAVAVGIWGSVAITWPGILRAAGEPTGYANANATLLALAAVAALGAAQEAPTARRAWLTLAAISAVATALPTSLAGILSLAAAALLLAITAVLQRPEVILLGGGLLVLICLSVTAAVAVGGDPAGLAERAGVRGELWAGAVEVLRDEPGRGVGPGRFEDLNPVTDDRDLRWAHHGYLQVGAEWGAPGLVMVLALGAWTWARLWLASAQSGSRAAVGGATLLIVGLHATVDYVWHLPAVLLVSALLFGNATARPAPNRRSATPVSP